MIKLPSFEGRKGGTIVPPSNFHSITTKGRESQQFTYILSRPYGRTGMHARVKENKLNYDRKTIFRHGEAHAQSTKGIFEEKFDQVDDGSKET